MIVVEVRLKCILRIKSREFISLGWLKFSFMWGVVYRLDIIIFLVFKGGFFKVVILNDAVGNGKLVMGIGIRRVEWGRDLI